MIFANKESFHNWEKWINDVKSQADPEITIMLVGNKVDKATSTTREVSTQEGEEYASKFKIMFCETSALADTNVTSAFEELMNKIDEVKLKNPSKGSSSKGYGLKSNNMQEFEDQEDSGWKW